MVGSGSFANEDSVFVVDEPRGSPSNDHVIALRNLDNSSRYIAMTSKCDIKARNVRPVTIETCTHYNYIHTV